MSKIKVQTPVVHTPSFTEYQIYATILKGKLEGLGLEIPMGILDRWYYYTDLEGWSKLLYNLVFKSSLYSSNKFDCENYALKAVNLCAERYGLNAFGMVIGRTPQGKHGFNIFYYGEGFMLWEPNEGYPFSGSAFEIGEYSYQPELVLI